MKFLILAVVLLALLIVYFGYPLYRATRISKQIEAETNAYEQHPSTPSISVLVAGDSTGVGTGASSPDRSIAGRIGTDLPNADITNVSRNGLTLAGLHDILLAQDGRRYDLMVLQIGANDIVGIGSFSVIRRELDAVLAEATERADQVVLLTAGNVGLAPVFRFPLSRFVTYRTREVRTIFSDAAASRSSVTYVDLFEERDEDVFGTDVARYYAADRFHPSGEGYGVWYEKVRPVMLLQVRE